MSPTGKSDSVRFVRACRAMRASEAKLRVPVRRCCFRGWAAEGRKVLRCVRARVPFPCRRKTTPLFYACLLIAVRSLQINSKLFPVASPCFSLLPAAFLLLPAAFRLKKCKSIRLDPQLRSSRVSLIVSCCKSLLIDSKSFPVASPCFSLLPAAFPLLPAAFRLKKSKSIRLLIRSLSRLLI